MDLLETLKQITNEKNIFLDEPMSKHTTFRTGGPAEFFVFPETIEELKKLLSLNVKTTVLGNGSNVLVTDKGIKGLVICTNKLRNYTITDGEIEAEAGLTIAKISQIALQNNLTGLEFACGIPGTLGGAVVMNAGAYGGEMKDIVVSSQYIDENNELKTITDHKFGYRKSIYTDEIKGTVVSAKIKLTNGDAELIKSKMDENMNSRNTKQPITMPSAGSTFKRKENVIVSKLIDEAGLKGYSIGGAQVSTLHAGFIVNTGNATSADILELIAYVQKVIKEKYDIDIETEVKIIGE